MACDKSIWVCGVKTKKRNNWHAVLCIAPPAPLTPPARTPRPHPRAPPGPLTPLAPWASEGMWSGSESRAKPPVVSSAQSSSVLQSSPPKGTGEGGSWCTCHISSPEDVCHKQFGARTAFKLVWCPGANNDFKTYTLVDDDGGAEVQVTLD